MLHKTYIAVVIAVGSLILAGCGGTEEQKMTSRLPPAEIGEYEGQDLSSIDDFRENSIKGPQHVSLDTYQLKVTGLVENPLSLTYEQVMEHEQYSKVVTLHCVEGWDATILWEGVLIDDLLKEAGVQEGAVIAIFHAADRTVEASHECARALLAWPPPAEALAVLSKMCEERGYTNQSRILARYAAPLG